MQQTELDLRGILELLRRRFKLILITIALILAVAGIVAFSLPPVYSASTLILVDPTSKNLLEPEPHFSSSAADNARIDSEVEILRSDSILLTVVTEQNLPANEAFAVRIGWQARLLAAIGLAALPQPSAETARDTALRQLRQALTVQRRGLTYLISVDLRSSDPETAARLANAVAKAYIDHQLDSKIADTLAAQALLVSQIDEARAALADAQTQLAAATAQAGAESRTVPLIEFNQAVELARSQHELLLARAQDLETQAFLQMADSRIVSPALVPIRPSSPNKALILVLAGLGAAGIGVTLAFLKENLIGGFTSEAQTAAVLRTRIASAIPGARSVADRSLADLMLTAPLSAFAEAIRRIQATIDRTGIPAPDSAESRGRVIMISSTAPGEGKTTLGLALARAYALSGRRTVLVDCDLRKPSVHRQLDRTPTQGLQDYLGADTPMSLGSVVSRDRLSEATVILGAHKSDVPTDQLLVGPAFTRLIEAARSSFEIVILDTPPVGPVVDALYVAPFADTVLFVVEASDTPQSDARGAIESLRETLRPEAQLLAVLNRQAETRPVYARKYRSYYQPA